MVKIVINIRLFIKNTLIVTLTVYDLSFLNIVNGQLADVDSIENCITTKYQNHCTSYMEDYFLKKCSLYSNVSPFNYTIDNRMNGKMMGETIFHDYLWKYAKDEVELNLISNIIQYIRSGENVAIFMDERFEETDRFHPISNNFWKEIFNGNTVYLNCAKMLRLLHNVTNNATKDDENANLEQNSVKEYRNGTIAWSTPHKGSATTIHRYTIENLTLTESYSLIFILNNFNNLNDTFFSIMVKYPSLVKIILNYEQCFIHCNNNEENIVIQKPSSRCDNKTNNCPSPSNTANIFQMNNNGNGDGDGTTEIKENCIKKEKRLYESMVKNLTKQLWDKYRVHHIYFISLCDNSLITDIDNRATSVARSTELYNKQGTSFPITTNSNEILSYNSIDDELTNISIQPFDNNRTEHCLQIFNQIVKQKKSRIQFLNLQNRTVKVTFFPTVMAYLKRTAGPKIISEKDYDNYAEILQYDESDYIRYDNKIDEFYGVDVEIMWELSKRMNFTPELIEPADKLYYGFRDANGDFTGALGDITKRRTEFSMIEFFIKDYETRDLEFTTAVSDDKLCIFVRKAQLVPASLLLSKVFSICVWITLVITLISVCIIYLAFLSIIDRMYEHAFYGRKANRTLIKPTYFNIAEYCQACLRITGILFTASVHKIGNNQSERLFLAVCMLWGIIITGAFRGLLMDAYTNPLSYSNIDTLEQLDKKSLPIHVRHKGVLVDVFGDDNRSRSQLLESLTKRIHSIGLESRIFEPIAYTGKMAGIERASSIYQYSEVITKDNGNPLLHMIKQCPKSYTLSFVLQKSSIYKSTLNHWLGLFLQSGLIAKWYKDQYFIFNLEGTTIYHLKSHNDHIRLSLMHLQIAFIVIIFGTIISIFVFVLELIIYYNKK